MKNYVFESTLSAMHPIGIVTIVVAVAIVLGVIVASVVRKAKGKPSLGSDCACCSHHGKCNGSCCSQNKDVDWSEIVKQRKAELESERDNQAKNAACQDRFEQSEHLAKTEQSAQDEQSDGNHSNQSSTKL